MKTLNISFSRRTLSLARLAIALIVLCAGIFFAPSFFPYKEVDYTDMHWQREPLLLAIDNERYQNLPALIVMRLSDGVQRYFTGGFHVNLSSQGNASVFGTIETSKKEKLYYIEGGKRIFPIDVTKIKGPILSAQESPNGAYLFLEIQNKKSTSYCIIERLSDTTKPTCENLSLGGTTKGIWNSHKDHELVALAGKNTIVTFDPWDKKPKRIIEHEHPKEFTDLHALFTTAIDQESIPSLGGTSKMIRFFSLVFIVTEKKHVSVVLVPPLSKISWFTDANHLLIKGRKQLSLLEISTHHLLPIFRNQNLEDKPIKFSLNGNQIAL